MSRNCILVILLSLSVLISGCNGGDTSEPSTDMTLIQQEQNGVELTVSEESVSQVSWDRSNAVTIELNGNTARISGSGAMLSEGNLIIRQPGTYVLAGTLDNGQILIDAKKDDIIQLVLNGVDLHNETGPAIYSPKSEAVIITLEPGTQNTVSDGFAYTTAGDEDEPNAAIYIQDSLRIEGGGALTVTSNYKHGIRAQDYLTITGGDISVHSVNDALRGRDGVDISGGSFTLVAGSDGIMSNNTNSDDVGYVNISGGMFSIRAGNDGIQAESSLTITGGTFDIFTGGGSANAPIKEKRPPGMRGREIIPAATESEAEESISMKGLKARALLTISGGDITIDAEDDGVHSDRDVLIEGGNLQIKSGDDGIHADRDIIISDGKINITYSYEGIEGLTITIAGGDIDVYAYDDGINAAGYAEGTPEAVRQANNDGRRRPFMVNDDNVLHITGGNIEVYALNDGIDSNGHINLEGGTLKISGPSMIMDGAIDLDGRFTVTGGELITAGSVQSVFTDSTQPFILVSYANEQPSGSVITVKDAGGNTLLEYTSKTAYSRSGFTSPGFQVGETYSLYINSGKRVDILLTGIVTGIGDDGGVYDNSRGVGPGSWAGKNLSTRTQV